MNDITRKTERKTLIAYHADCIDGFTSAWVMATALQAKDKKAELFAMEYTDDSADELIDICAWDGGIQDIYVVDFSLDITTLRLLAVAEGINVTIYDHHKTAFELYCPQVKVTETARWEGKVHGANIVLANNQSGASLCWNEVDCIALSTATSLITYVQDYDLWLFNRGDETKWVNKYLAMQPKTLENWSRIASDLYCDPRRILLIGRNLQEEHDLACEKVASEARSTQIGGHDGLVVLCPRALTSDVGHILATRSGTFGCMYVIDKEKEVVNYSLRSNGDFDVSTIAKKFGGGGHKNAAGFVIGFVEGEPDDSIE